MIIYKATNKNNNKSYIGLTEDLGTRQRGHYDEATSGSNTYFHKALRKYDASNWGWEVLDECDTREEAGELEVKLIEEYDTFRTGYNSTTGGEKGVVCDPGNK